MIGQGDFYYAIISQPQITKVSIAQNNAQITIPTDAVKAVIGNASFTVSFLLVGKMINKEKVLNNFCVNKSVTVYRKLQKDERFIGLGEKISPFNRSENGYIDWN